MAASRATSVSAATRGAGLHAITVTVTSQRPAIITCRFLDTRRRPTGAPSTLVPHRRHVHRRHRGHEELTHVRVVDRLAGRRPSRRLRTGCLRSSAGSDSRAECDVQLRPPVATGRNATAGRRFESLHGRAQLALRVEEERRALRDALALGEALHGLACVRLRPVRPSLRAARRSRCPPTRRRAGGGRSRAPRRRARRVRGRAARSDPATQTCQP